VSDFELLIVGGGLAAGRAAKAYREAGRDGRLALVSRERSLPYHRPPLSKGYLRGEQEPEAALVEPESFYAAHGVELLLGAAIERVVPAEHRIALGGGRELGYGKLLIATGASPRRLSVPGDDLGGVLTLRTIDDATAIREAAVPGHRAVVVGGGFIGLEVAASLRTVDVAVTLVHRGALFEQLRCRELSRFLAELYRVNGVELVSADGVARLRGRRRVEAVETIDGELLEADFVVAGVGVEPATRFLAGSGLRVADGVVVDERFRTSAPDVSAAGDVANVYDGLAGRRRRIEHWSNASYQGMQAGRALAGDEVRFDAVSTFFTEVFGRTLKVFGDISRHDELRVRGSFADLDAVALYLDRGRIVGALVTGQDDATEQRLKDAIAARGRPPDLLAA
jgi:3-phenylpropionate/trans-cinnamate dioxygenase ferredoxin reductase subunit